MPYHYTKEEDDLLIKLSKENLQFKEIYNIFSITFPERKKNSVESRFYRQLKLKPKISINHYTKEEENYIIENIKNYRISGMFDRKRFLDDFNSKFNNKITYRKLESLMYKLNVKRGKAIHSEWGKLYDKSRYKIGDEVVDKRGNIFLKTKNGWKLKHVAIYEKHYNIKVLKNEAISFIDGNKKNFNIENLIKISKLELHKMIRYQNIKDIEIRKTMYKIFKLECLIEQS